MIAGNKGSDTINVGSTASNNGSVAGGMGLDTILLNASVVNWVNGGAGTDSIAVSAGSSFSTLGGGGLGDTITFASTFAGGKVYGDAIGTTTVGTGTEGAADGNDSITVVGATTAGGLSLIHI